MNRNTTNTDMHLIEFLLLRGYQIGDKHRWRERMQWMAPDVVSKRNQFDLILDKKHETKTNGRRGGNNNNNNNNIGNDFYTVIDQVDSDNDDEESEKKVDESTTKEHLYLCERWKNARQSMFLLNQVRDFGRDIPDGSISALVSDKYVTLTVTIEHKDACSPFTPLISRSDTHL